MTTHDLVAIDSVYTRSINVERDADSESVVNAYIPTSRSILTLNRIAETLHNENALRSWALIGPYGSGKSSFTVFLSHLLGNPENCVTSSALKVLKGSDEGLYEKYTENTNGSKGYLQVLIAGSPEPLAKRFLEGLIYYSKRYWKNIPGPKPGILKKLARLKECKELSLNSILVHLNALQTAVAKAGGKGVLIVLDELGKFLEYEARHYGANDIYLLQMLAEHANIGSEATLHIVALLHQSFEIYGRGLGENLRNEWAKIQGRYENIPFLETTEQTLRVMSRAFKNKFNSEQNGQIQRNCNKIADILFKEKALPDALSVETATELFSKIYPLHPISALILPYLCQKMAQNERTLFSYLGSREPYGLHDRLNTVKSIQTSVLPWEIYEYFILNQPAILTDSTTNRRWAEVVTALERLGDVPPIEIKLLKTIGLLNIIGAQDGLKASKRLIRLCFPKSQSTAKALKVLENKSIIQFRKFSGEYRVWQGSDFDLEDGVQSELNQIGRFDLPEAINIRENLQPVVARRHTITTGNLRYFVPIFVDTKTFQREPKCADRLRLIICLVETVEDSEIFENVVKSHFSKYDVVAMSPSGTRLREAVGEVIALKRLQMSRQELNSDPVAQREYKDRLSAAEEIEDRLLLSFFDSPETCQWYWNREKIDVKSKKSFQVKISGIVDELYHSAPIIKNELINRDKPSAQAIAARNKLVSALLRHSDLKDLGIDKYPAEKALYRAIFLATGLHNEFNGRWRIVPPSSKSLEPINFNLSPCWDRVVEFLASTEDDPKSFAELDAELYAPPYGIKLGVIPLLYFAVFLCYKDELALYENGVYVPYITSHHIERFFKRPDFFGVQRIQIKGIRASLLQEYTKVLYGEGRERKNLLAIAKPLAKFMVELEDYTKNTARISDTAQKFRKAFDNAKSPAELLFARLPEACGFHSIDPEENDTEKVNGFSSSLVAVIRELRDAYSTMHSEFQDVITLTLLPDSKTSYDLSGLRNKLKAKYEDLSSYTADIKGLRPFIELLSKDDGDDRTWFNRILLFLSNKSPKKWTDTVRDGAVARLLELSKRLIDLSVLQSYYLKNRTRYSNEFDVILLKTMRHGYKDYNEVVTIDEGRRKYISGISNKVSDCLNELNSDDDRLAVLAELVDGILEKRENSKIEHSDEKLRAINE